MTEERKCQLVYFRVGEVERESLVCGGTAQVTMLAGCNMTVTSAPAATVFSHASLSTSQFSADLPDFHAGGDGVGQLGVEAGQLAGQAGEVRPGQLGPVHLCQQVGQGGAGEAAAQPVQPAPHAGQRVQHLQHKTVSTDLGLNKVIA